MKANHLAERMPEVYGFALPVVEMAAMPSEWVAAVSRDLRTKRPWNGRRQAHEPGAGTMAETAARRIGVGELSRLLSGENLLR